MAADHRRRHKDMASLIAQRRTLAHQRRRRRDPSERWRMISHRGAAGRAPRLKTAPEAELAISMVKMADQSPAPIYASLVKGDGDDSFTLIWSRRNGD